MYKIGEGNFGEVYLHHTEKGDLAVKRIEPRSLRYIELDILFRIDCPYLLRGHEIQNEPFGIVMDRKEGDLYKFNFHHYFDLLRVFGTLTYAVYCLHSKGFLHLDIKPSNCLYEIVKIENLQTYNAVLADFGLSTRVDDAFRGIKTKSLRGTHGYFSPEILKNKRDKKEYIYSDKSDVFALGVTFLKLLGFSYHIKNKKNNYLKVLEFWEQFEINSLDNLIILVKKYNSRATTPIPEEQILPLVSLLEGMLRVDPDERYSSKDVYRDSLFTIYKLDKRCLVKEPEFYYIPYINYQTIKGVELIRNIFREDYYMVDVSIYFLCIEYFMNLMAHENRDIPDEEYNAAINECVYGALNYYKGVNNSDIANDALRIPNIFDGMTGVNRYYYEASSADQLRLVDSLILSDSNMLNFYLVLDVSKLYRYFSDNYKICSSINMNCGDFFYGNDPIRIKDIEVNLAPGEYKRVEKKIEIQKEPIYLKYTSIEEKIRGNILNEVQAIIKKNDSREEIKAKANKMIESTNFRYLLKSENLNLIESLKELLGLDIFYEGREKFFDQIAIFIDRHKKPSIIVATENELIHYFSPKNDYLSGLCKSLKLKYKRKSMNINPCRTLEAGIIVAFLIAKELKSFDVRMMRCSDNTLKSMLLYSLLS